MFKTINGYETKHFLTFQDKSLERFVGGEQEKEEEDNESGILSMTDIDLGRCGYFGSLTLDFSYLIVSLNTHWFYCMSAETNKVKSSK